MLGQYREKDRLKTFEKTDALFGERRNLKALTVGRRRKPGRAFKQTAEKRRIFVAHLPADLIDRNARTLEAAFGVLDP